MSGLQKAGGSAIEQEERARQEARKAAFADRLGIFSLKDSETTVLRLLSDSPDWYKITMHNFVKTKPGPAAAKNWPKGMGAVCLYDEQIGGDECYICDNKLPGARSNEFQKPSLKTWGLGVMRQKVIGDGSPDLGGPERKGQFVGVDDVWEEYTLRGADGKPTEQKGTRIKLVTINMSWSNFFASFHHTFNATGSAVDRDFIVTRAGEGTDTKYLVTSMDKTDQPLRPGTPGWERYIEQARYWVTDKDALGQPGVDPIDMLLQQEIMKQASAEHFARWFDPRVEVDKTGKVVPAGTTAKDTKPSASAAPSASVQQIEESEQDLAALRARLSTPAQG